MAESVGTVRHMDMTYELRDYPVNTGDGIFLPLLDGTDVFIEGNFYPTSLKIEGLDSDSSENVTLVGNNKVWQSVNRNNKNVN
jgi:hypothetical protein